MTKITGILLDIRYPIFKMAGYPAKLLSGPSLVLIREEFIKFLFHIYWTFLIAIALKNR